MIFDRNDELNFSKFKSVFNTNKFVGRSSLKMSQKFPSSKTTLTSFNKEKVFDNVIEKFRSLAHSS
jgi:hypothetical protein